MSKILEQLRALTQRHRERKMIDKAAQRARAQQMSQSLAAQGHVAPKLTFPVSQPKPPVASAPVKVSTPLCKYDCAGQILSVGDKVATTLDGMVSSLVVGTVTGFAPKKLYIDVPSQPGSREARHGLAMKSITKFPEQVAKLVL